MSGPDTPADDAMSAEFDTVASWTAEAARELGPEYHLPAACRGSGTPSALIWLLDRLDIGRDATLLDCGAGVGGPAAFAIQRHELRAVLTDPEFGACLAAHRLFGLPALQAGPVLPVRPGSVDAAWALGVLCTVDDQPGFLAELYRVLRGRGRLGLLVYVARRQDLPNAPDGNNFPSEDEVDRLLEQAGFLVRDRVHGNELAPEPASWHQRADAVQRRLADEHGHEPAWAIAQRQTEAIGRLIADGDIEPLLLVARPRTDR